VTGCTKVSEGCDHCYAETFAERWRGIAGHPFEQGFDVRLWPERLEAPLRRRKPTRYFVNSMSDLWHDAVDLDFLARVFAVMALADRHTFQVLTKRPGRMHSVLASGQFWGLVRATLGDHGPPSPGAAEAVDARRLPNLWLGVSVESQKWAGVRLDKLAATTAGAVRFASCEPLLGTLDLRPWLGSGLDWVIAGGESGPRARPMHPAWVRSLRDQCEEASVPYFFKQRGQWTWDSEPGQAEPRTYVRATDGRVADARTALADGGSWAGVWRVGKGRAGRLLDGRTWDEFPRPTQTRVPAS
jgi:protein gp37